MATVNPVSTPLSTYGDNVRIVTWTGLATGDTIGAFEMPGWADRSVQFGGTFGGATLTFTGSNDGTNFIGLTDPQGNAISKTAAAIEAVLELTRYVKPGISGGAGDSVNVTLLIKT